MQGDVEGQLWPVYVVADESASMSPYVHELNAGLDSTCRALLAQPMVAAKVRFSVVGFSDDATVHMRLADLRDGSEPTPLVARDGTNYGAVFDSLRNLIPADVATLKSQRYAVYRPAVFFLSDGEPNDASTWQQAHRRLTDRTVTREGPNIIACGIGDVRTETIRQVATQPQFAFVAVAGYDVGNAITEFCGSLTKSIVASTRTFGGEQDSIIVEPPAGFKVVLDAV